MGAESRSSSPGLAERIVASLPGLTRFVRRRMGPELAARESASDIVQSTCRELLRAGSSFEDQGEAAFRRWLRGAAEHKLRNRARHWRAARRAGDGPGLDGAGGTGPAAPLDAHPSQEAELAEEAHRLEAAFRALSSEQRHVLVRSQIDGLSHADLARELGKTPEAARKLVARALARLATGLAPEA